MGALQMARVNYDVGRAYEVVNVLTQYANMTNLPERGPGLTQDNAVALAAHLTSLRSVCLNGRTFGSSFAWWRDSTFLGIRAWNNPVRDPDFTATSLPVYGEDRFRVGQWDNGELGSSWPLHISLAVEHVLCQLVKAEVTGQVQDAWDFEHILDVGVVPCILAGPAVRVLKKPAVWRFASRSLQMNVAYVANAADGYEQRIARCEQEGRQIEPTRVETLAAAYIRDLLTSRRNIDWAKGAGTLAGTSIGVTLLGYIRSRAA